MEIKPLATKRGPKSALKSQRIPGEEERVRRVSLPSRANSAPAPVTGSPSSVPETNMLHFHKSHQGILSSTTKYYGKLLKTLLLDFLKVESWSAKWPFKSPSSIPKCTH